MTHFTMNESMETNKAWQECLDEVINEHCLEDSSFLSMYHVQLAAEKYSVRFIEQTIGDGWLQVRTGIWMNGIDHKIPMTERRTTQQLLEQFNNQPQ